MAYKNLLLEPSGRFVTVGNRSSVRTVREDGSGNGSLLNVVQTVCSNPPPGSHHSIPNRFSAAPAGAHSTGRKRGAAIFRMVLMSTSPASVA